MGISNTDGTTMKKTQQPAPGGPDAQWSADGQWWWDGDVWTQMWEPPPGLSWDGQTWVRAADPPVLALHPAEPESEPEPERQVHISTREDGPPRGRPPRRARSQAEDRRQARTPHNPPAPSTARFAPPRFVPEQPSTAQRSGAVVVLAPPPPPAAPVYPQAPSNLRRIPNRTTWLVAAAMVLVVAGIFSGGLGISLGGQSGGPGSSQASRIGAGRPTPLPNSQAPPGPPVTPGVGAPPLPYA